MKLKLDPKIFNKVYLPHLFDYSHRYNVYYGGRCSGKSYFISDKLLIKGLNDKRRMLFLMKQGNKVKDTIWTLFIDSIQKFKIYDQCKINKTDFTIELPNGTYIKMTGMDDPEKAKGFVDIDTVWFEECTSFSEEDIDLVDGTLRGPKKNKEIYFSFNPVSKQNWVYKFFGFDKGIVPPDTFILKTTYKDNKWCSEAEIKRLERLKERNPARYKIEAEGDFATLDKLIFTYKEEGFDYQEILKHSGAVGIFGLDFGFVNDPTAFVCAVADTTFKKLYIYDEYFRRGMLNIDIARMIAEKGYSKEIIIADCQEAKSIAEIKNFGISRIKRCRKGKDSIKHGIDKLQEYEIIVHPRCENIKDELDNYSWKKDKSTGEYLNIPIDTWNHGMDALRYSIQGIKKKAKFIDVKL
ncbi:MAG: PBSX family phage terminase large subunit [Cellulosilyticaceae bacterium]